MARAFTPRKPRTHVGGYRPKMDGRLKASGQAEYLSDIAIASRFPGMLEAKVLRSPHAHARVKSMDTSRAEALAGVDLVLRYDDPEIMALKPTTNAWTSFNTAAYDTMYFPCYRDRKVLGDVAHWAGDEVGAVVAAESAEIAEQALSLIEVEWEVLPFVLDPKEALKPGAPVIHPEINPEGNEIPPDPLCGPPVYKERGDVETAFAQALAVVEAEAYYANNDHGCLETRTCLITCRGDELTCWSNLYQADQTRMFIAQMLDMPLHKVRVICPYIGGSFGRGNTGDQTYYIFTAIAARRTGRPVRFKHTRREDFHDTRNAISWRIKLGADTDGTIIALDCYGLGDSGAYVDHTVAALKYMTGFEIDECLLAPIPNVRMEARAVYTNKIPGSCKRGIGNNQFNYALFWAVELLAEKLGLDPVEVTKKSFSHEWEKPPNQSVGAVLDEGAARIGWQRRLPTGQAPVTDGAKKRGLGFSLHQGWHTAWQEIPRGRIQLGLKLNPDLSLILEAPMAETGPGSNSCAVFACADHLTFLGITPKDIKWVEKADTETGYKDMVQTDSAVSYLHAEVMPQAAALLKARLIDMAAEKLERDPAEIDIQEGRAFATTPPETGMAIKELLWNETMTPILVTVDMLPPEEVTGVPYEAAFAEVEVDMETGMVDVLKIVQLNDCGTVMYAAGAEAQQVGGQAMALGETLTEELILDPKTGVPLNFNWVDYQMPTMLDIPEVEPVPLEVWQGAGEYGACGIGESVTTCTSRAIANAIYNATGARIETLPIKPEVVLAALAVRESRDGEEAGA